MPGIIQAMLPLFRPKKPTMDTSEDEELPTLQVPKLWEAVQAMTDQEREDFIERTLEYQRTRVPLDQEPPF